jgi:hypothetical protein
VKFISCLIVLVLWLPALAHGAEDRFSGRAWLSKFETCKCEVSSPLLLQEGVAYLYNPEHDFIQRIGLYEIRDGEAILTGYLGQNALMKCSMRADGSLSIMVTLFSDKMGPAALRDKDLMPWSLPPITELKMLKKAKELIKAEKEKSLLHP